MKNHLKKKYINILYRMDQTKLQNKIDNLDELISKKLKQFAKLIPKRQGQKHLAKEER